MTGLYIHIPFCASRCIYCGFYSTTLAHEQDRYVSALCREMEMRKDELQGSLSTVYIGGGTPSLLSAENMRRIFLYINKVYAPDWDSMEFTMECNPDDVTKEFCMGLRLTPINRVSMGAQTFSDSRLKFIHRRHNSSEVFKAMKLLREHGIGNVSIDLMFGFPNETLSDWTSDVDTAISLRPEHISAYSLQYEEGTPLYRMLSEVKVKEIDDELYRKMYATLCEKLSEAGYEHYEISNFALPGRRSRHNSSYWHNIPYIGLGASAHSYSGHSRSWNVSNLEKYISSIENGVRPAQSEDIDGQTHYDDMVMTALRTKEGISLDDMPEKYRRYIMATADKYIKAGEMKCDGHWLSLTIDGIFVSDMIMSDLMMPD